MKYEIRSYQEMVERRIKQINENSQQLVKFKDKITQEQKHSKVLAESVSRLSEELRKNIEKSHMMRQQTKLLLEENKGEVIVFESQIALLSLSSVSLYDALYLLSQ